MLYCSFGASALSPLYLPYHLHNKQAGTHACSLPSPVLFSISPDKKRAYTSQQPLLPYLVCLGSLRNRGSFPKWGLGLQSAVYSCPLFSLPIFTSVTKYIWARESPESFTLLHGWVLFGTNLASGSHFPQKWILPSPHWPLGWYLPRVNRPIDEVGSTVWCLNIDRSVNPLLCSYSFTGMQTEEVAMPVLWQNLHTHQIKGPASVSSVSHLSLSLPSLTLPAVWVPWSLSLSEPPCMIRGKE